MIKMRQLNRDSLLVCVMLVSCCAAFAGIEETTGTLKSQPYKDKSGQKNKLSETQAMAREYREQGLAFQRQGDPVTALSFYQKAVELDPAYAVVYNDLGVVYEAMRFIDRAEESYLKAVKLDPEYLSAYTNLALLYENKRDLEKAERICYNAKVQRPATCNAMETMLVHKNIAEKFLPGTAKKMKEAGVELRGCSNTRKILPDIKEATEDDWYAEYLDLILAVRVVSSFDEAVDHIAKYGSSHSDAIVTENVTSANRFTNEVDSAAVYVNASTRLTDGGQFGMGAEIGISTDKLHARGPMGLPELTSYKFVIHGDGQIRE